MAVCFVQQDDNSTGRRGYRMDVCFVQQDDSTTGRRGYPMVVCFVQPGRQIKLNMNEYTNIVLKLHIF
jgi:hypothetical protein